MSSSTPTVVIVDPFSTGADLAPCFAAAGWQTIAVLSTPDLPDLYLGRIRGDDFAEVVVHHGDLAATTAAAAAHRPIAVVAGTEIGVPMADALAAALGVPGNDPARSAARRDKIVMAEITAAAGLATPATLRCADGVSATAWAAAADQWPVVVKPVDSAGADGVRFCADVDEVREAVDALVGVTNRMGSRNDTVVVQEMLVGIQYFVNTVSRAGRHYVAEIWRDSRTRVPGAGLVCDREDLLPAHGDPQDLVAGYVCDVLDALGIAWGPAHTELMLTARGPVLIETAARMQGTILHEAVVAATGESHVTLTAEAITDPARFDTRTGTGYPLSRAISVVSLIAPVDGHFGDAATIDELCTLPSVHDILGDITADGPVERTVDLFTAPGFLYLVADSSGDIERDYQRIRAIEHNGLYTTR